MNPNGVGDVHVGAGSLCGDFPLKACARAFVGGGGEVGGGEGVCAPGGSCDKSQCKKIALARVRRVVCCNCKKNKKKPEQTASWN